MGRPYSTLPALAGFGPLYHIHCDLFSILRRGICYVSCLVLLCGPKCVIGCLEHFKSLLLLSMTVLNFRIHGKFLLLVLNFPRMIWPFFWRLRRWRFVQVEILARFSSLKWPGSQTGSIFAAFFHQFFCPGSQSNSHLVDAKFCIYGVKTTVSVLKDLKFLDYSISYSSNWWCHILSSLQFICNSLYMASQKCNYCSIKRFGKYHTLKQSVY